MFHYWTRLTLVKASVFPAYKGKPNLAKVRMMVVI